MGCLPFGVSGELACCIPGLLEVVSFDTHASPQARTYLTAFGTSLGSSTS